MSTLSNVPFFGLGFIVIGFVGFLVMAINVDNHLGLFAIIFCWYSFAIFWAGMALVEDVRQARHAGSELR